MDVQFVGIKAQTINKEGGRERRYDVVGFEEVTYIASFKVKTGDEELVDPPNGTRCQDFFTHTLKRGERAYYLGKCQKQYRSLLTLERLEGFLDNSKELVRGVLVDSSTREVIYRKGLEFQ